MLDAGAYICIYVGGCRFLRPPPARWYGCQIPGLLLLLAAALTAALAIALAAALAACAAAAGWLPGWLAGAGPCFIDRNA